MRIATCACFALFLAAATPSRAQMANTLSEPAASVVSPRGDGFEVRRGRVLMRVTALASEIIRVRIARDALLPEDASWAVLPEMRAHHVTVTPLANGFATEAIHVVVDPNSLALTITDLSGKVITADGSTPISLQGSVFTLRKELPRG